MPTLYDNFSQVKQYIDQEKPDMTSYVTKTELANASYVTSSDLNGYLPLTGGTMTGQITLNNAVRLQVGSERPWEIYEGGTGGNASLTIRNTVDGKHLYIKDINYNNIVDIHNNLTGSGYIKFSYAANAYTNNIIPNETNTYTLGDSSHLYNATYSTYLMNTSNAGFYASSNYTIHMLLNGANRYFWDTEKFSVSSNNTRNLGSASLKWKSTYTYNLYTDTAYISSATYLPKNTYWYDGSSYHWLGNLFN